MKVSLTLYVPEVVAGGDPFANYTTRSRSEKVSRLIRLLKSMAGGGILTRNSRRPSLLAGTAYATGTVTLATVSAADTVTINGSALTAANGSPTAEQFDMSGTDAADATTLVTAINTTSTAALITGLVKASNLAGQVTCASAAVGDTVAIGGVTLTAVAAASAKADEFSISGNDSADATALVNAINAHPVLKELVLASAASAVVTVRQLPFDSTSPLVLTTSNATRLAAVAVAATAVVLIAARDKGKEGNCMTIASSNASRLAIGGSATRLLGGTDATSIAF